MKYMIKSIVEFTLQNVDWSDGLHMEIVTDILAEKINVALSDTFTVAVVRCNGVNNTEEMLENGELAIDILLVNSIDLTTEILTAHMRTETGSTVVLFEENW